LRKRKLGFLFTVAPYFKDTKVRSEPIPRIKKRKTSLVEVKTVILKPPWYRAKPMPKQKESS